MIKMKINGQEQNWDGDPTLPLLWFLRDEIGLTGTKFGCGQALCGACTVIVDKQAVRSCITAVSDVVGREVTTIEGLGTPTALHPLQRAFVEHDGFQCGYCTPGQICSAVGMLGELGRGVPSHVTSILTAEQFALTHDELRERMSGNLCRCGAYNGIVDAISEFHQEAQ